jgi:hypothetical protein
VTLGEGTGLPNYTCRRLLCSTPTDTPMFRKIKSAQPTRAKPRSSGFRLSVQALEERRVLASAVLDISIQNLAPTDGLVLTPAWIAAHNGNFDTARAGAAASGFGGLEQLAEDGIVDGLRNRLKAQQASSVDAVLSAAGGFAGSPVIEPGETATGQLNVTTSEINRFFSYASAVVPSNDAFVTNLNSRSVVLFRPDGTFAGPVTINIYGHDVYDPAPKSMAPTWDPHLQREHRLRSPKMVVSELTAGSMISSEPPKHPDRTWQPRSTR